MRAGALILILALAAMVGFGLALREGQKPSPPDKIQVDAAPPAAVFWLISRGSTFKSFQDFRQWLEFVPSVYQGQPVTQMEFDVRNLKRHLRLARLPYFEQIDARINDQHPIKGREYGVSDRFDPRDLWQLATVEPGTYQVALLVNGIRVSNVIQIKIDPIFDATKEPVLSLGMLEAPPLFPHGLLLASVVGPTPEDKAFTGAVFEMLEVETDGVACRRSPLVSIRGPSLVPIGSGAFSWLLLRPEGYTPVLPVSGPHEYQIRAGTFASDKIRLNLTDQALGKSWDEATPTIKDAPHPTPVVEGTVHDADGKPYPGMVVEVDASRTMTDEKGHYAIWNIPAGAFHIECYSPYKYPLLGMQIYPVMPTNLPTIADLSFAGKYSIGGRVTRAEHGVAGLKMNVTWEKHDVSNACCVTQAVTDANGRYQSRGPYPIIHQVEFNFDGVVKHPPPPQTYIEPGRADIDFTLSGP